MIATRPFVEERVALARDLDEVAERWRRRGTENPDATAAGRRVDADDLLVAADLVERDVERHRVDVEAALRVHGLAGRAQLQQIEDGLDVGIEAVVPLAGEGEVAVLELGDRLRRVAIEVALVADAVLGGLLAVVVAVVLGVAFPWLLGGTMPRPSRVDRAGAPVDLVDGVALDQVLRGVADVADHAEIRLQDRVAVPVASCRTGTDRRSVVRPFATSSPVATRIS